MINRLRTINLIVSTAVLVALASLTAHAQKPALTQNIDEKGRVPYHSNTYAVSFAGVSFLYFAADPAGYRLVVTHASLTYQGISALSTIPTSWSVQVAPTMQATEPYREYLPTPTSGGNNFYIASSPVTYYVEAVGIPS